MPGRLRRSTGSDRADRLKQVVGGELVAMLAGNAPGESLLVQDDLDGRADDGAGSLEKRGDRVIDWRHAELRITAPRQRQSDRAERRLHSPR